MRYLCVKLFKGELVFPMVLCSALASSFFLIDLLEGVMLQSYGYADYFKKLGQASLEYQFFAQTVEILKQKFAIDLYQVNEEIIFAGK